MGHVVDITSQDVNTFQQPRKCHVLDVRQEEDRDYRKVPYRYTYGRRFSRFIRPVRTTEYQIDLGVLLLGECLVWDLL